MGLSPSHLDSDARARGKKYPLWRVGVFRSSDNRALEIRCQGGGNGAATNYLPPNTTEPLSHKLDITNPPRPICVDAAAALRSSSATALCLLISCNACGV